MEKKRTGFTIGLDDHECWYHVPQDQEENFGNRPIRLPNLLHFLIQRQEMIIQQQLHSDKHRQLAPEETKIRLTIRPAAVGNATQVRGQIKLATKGNPDRPYSPLR